MKIFREALTQGYGQTFSVNKMIFEHKTPHQHLVIFENERFARVMALDGIIQTTERDEFIYHEMLTHVPAFAHGNLQNALIIGGGDGGILRELVKHKTIQTITQVEIDQTVIDTCREYLPNHSHGAFDDPRLDLVIDDGMNFVSSTNRRFDLIISDCTDPVGPGEVLFSTSFYQACKDCLREGGIFVAQNGVPFFQPEELTQSSKKLQSLFT
nr:polyamine aminopropyltransferase [Endozoicomonas sp.]